MPRKQYLKDYTTVRINRPLATAFRAAVIEDGDNVQETIKRLVMEYLEARAWKA